LLLDHRGGHSSQPFTIPATWTTDKEAQEFPAPRYYASSPSAAAAASAVGPSNNEMSTAELQLVTRKCLASLRELMDAPPSSDPTKAGVRDRWFMCLVVTATLALGLAPRSMVLSQLKIGSSPTRGEDGRFWVKLLAQQSKNNRPTCFALPLQLTSVYGHYLEQVRPRLLAQATAAAASSSAARGDVAHVFMKRNSTASRTDFNSCVNLVTQEFLGRPLNTHSFRSAITTAYYDKTCGSENELIILSQIMGHDIGTARSARRQAQRDTHTLTRNCTPCSTTRSLHLALRAVLLSGLIITSPSTAALPWPPMRRCQNSSCSLIHEIRIRTRFVRRWHSSAGQPQTSAAPLQRAPPTTATSASPSSGRSGVSDAQATHSVHKLNSTQQQFTLRTCKASSARLLVI
jgi:hypothetical protein